MDAVRLAAIKQRLEQVQDLAWMQRYASDETKAIIFEDTPELIKFAEESLEAAHASNDNKGKARKGPRRKASR